MWLAWRGSQFCCSGEKRGRFLADRSKKGTRMKFTVGMKINGKTDHTAVDAEDALIAALKVKMQRPEAEILYVRRANKRGDTRHPARPKASP
jgi:hypothetical protein